MLRRLKSPVSSMPQPRYSPSKVVSVDLRYGMVQWNPAITKCHGTEKNVRYSGVFNIAKTPL